jgi:histone H3
MPRTKQVAQSRVFLRSSDRRPVVAAKSPFRFIMKKHLQSRLRDASGNLIRKPYKHKPGTVALREIRKQQRSTDMVLPKAPFQRLVRELSINFKSDLRFEREALLCLQEAAESHLVNMFQHSHNLAIYTGRKTLRKTDVEMSTHIREDSTNIVIPKHISPHKCNAIPTAPTAPVDESAMNETQVEFETVEQHRQTDTIIDTLVDDEYDFDD